MFDLFYTKYACFSNKSIKPINGVWINLKFSMNGLEGLVLFTKIYHENRINKQSVVPANSLKWMLNNICNSFIQWHWQ